MKALLLLLLCTAVPLAIQAWQHLRGGVAHWSVANWRSSGLAPDPATHEPAVVQVYAARAWGWKGVFAVHTWISFKRAGASEFERYEVVGWGVSRGLPAIRRNLRPADSYWAGNPPRLLADIRGPRAAGLIPRIEKAIRFYPYPYHYRSWPGPNSNTFIAHILRSVPAIGTELPPEALGKDYLGTARLWARTPSGSGYQISLWGLAGITLAWDEGLELQLLGLTFGIDARDRAIKLPGVGQLALWSGGGPRVKGEY